MAGSLPRSFGFAPIADTQCRTLVLGSLPGRMSLEHQQYYSQPRNAFWRIMGECFGAGPEQPYALRVQCLLAAGVAVWDVCAAAHRPGSLDSAIDPQTIAVNDFARFFALHPRLDRVLLNGGAAARLYQRRVLPTLAEHARALHRVTLPSTSPAHAALNFGAKLAFWRAALLP